MTVTVPSYYKDFKCIADKCKHSCCIGWEIDIDDETFDFYKSVKGDFGKKLKSYIKSESGINSFILDKNERCPFLNKDNLCDIYIEIGENNLCQICTDHPRFRNYLSDCIEMGLGMCCEEAARLILSQESEFKMVLLKDTDEEINLTEDEEYILNIREDLYSILYENENDIENGINKIFDFMEYLFPDKSLSQWVDLLLNLEILDQQWKALLENVKSNENEIIKIDFKGFNRAFINLIIYFLFRHMVNCSDWEDLCARVSFSVFAYRLIKILCINKLIESEECNFEDLCEYARLFSSEIEYSQENMDAVLDMLKT